MDQPNHCLFTPGTLWTTLLERTTQAKHCGAIQSLSTVPEVIQQNGMTFHVRRIKALAMKSLPASSQKDSDPFLPYDPDLFVTEVSKTHVALLNKFNVVEPHLLIVTRAFESQETLLTQEDCEALRYGLSEIDGLGFYNAGKAAGASQRHKHLQLIPLSSITHERLPIEPLLDSVKMLNQTGVATKFPFLHAYAPMNSAWLGPHGDGAKSLLACYHELLRAVGLSVEPSPQDSAPPSSYNLLVTRQWLMVVPRSQEYFEGISINALGFAGAFLVKDATQFARLKKYGPMTALQCVTFPRQS